ncbi:MAG: HRDC domain-containing protein [Chlorobium sp.]
MAAGRGAAAGRRRTPFGGAVTDNRKAALWRPKFFFDGNPDDAEISMQIKLFTIPVGDSGAAEQELNTFLKANKVLEVENRLISNKNSACWCFCVRYAESSLPNPSGADHKTRPDYRKVLDEPTFNKFSALREKRKKAAIDEGVSAFIIFTDEELAALAKLDEVTEKNMLAIKGIGEKKVERFARYFTEKSETNEATGTAD